MDETQSAPPALEWHAVWQEHSGWLRTVLRARVRDDAVADELLQAVSVTAWTRREQLCDGDRIGPWLYRIALRQVLMFLRTQQRHRRRFVSLEIDPPREPVQVRETDPLVWLVRAEVHERVRQSLDTLAAQDREILMLRHSEQWTYRQIAQYLGISTDKVIRRLGRARSRLRRVLMGWQHDWKSP